MADTWTIDVDSNDDGLWEATLVGTPLHWASSDPHTLMAAIGRDLATEAQS